MPRYHVTGSAHGQWSRTVDAESADAAIAMVSAEVEADDWHTDLEQIDDVSVDFAQEMLVPLSPPRPA